jgi:aliphatic nitrilase
MTSTRTVVAAHLAPVFLDPSATTAKAVDAIAEAARSGADLVAFPESYIPGFPVWAALRAPSTTTICSRPSSPAPCTSMGPRCAPSRRRHAHTP